MKIKFKHFAIVALAFSVGLASCSKKNGESQESESLTKTVSVNINVDGATTRAPGSETASGVTPDVTDIKLFFVGGTFIQQIASVNAGGEHKFTVPLATTKVYAIGNTSNLTLPKVGDSESAINSVMLDIEDQTTPKAVNLSQGQGNAGVGLVDNKAGINLMPAFARYEIKEVSANKSAVQPLKEFELSAIYITNTYLKLGLDYITLPTAPADIINAGPSSDLSGIPSVLKDILEVGDAAASFKPSEGNTYWGYFLNAPVAGNGTSLSGSKTDEGSVPIIILEIKNAVTGVEGGSITYAETSYVNVRKLIKSGESTPITALEPGNVYIINNIAIGGEHLTTEPGEVHDKEVTVTVEVKPWNPVEVAPGL